MKQASVHHSILLITSIFLLSNCSDTEKVTKSMKIVKGTVNGVFIERGGKLLTVYGDPSGSEVKADMVLFTHFRRDVTWAGMKLLDAGARGVAPAGEKAFFTSADSVIQRMPGARFHDYYCQTTKFPVKPLNISRFVAPGEMISWEGIDFKVLSSPGYTRNAVSFLAEIDGKKIAFTGDLIYGDGQLIDIYSLQDSFQSTGGYHGYATRLGEVITSLQAVRDWKPDLIIPSRGPVIDDPLPAIDSLTERIRELYRNYLSISALRWYFPDRMPGFADHVLGPGAIVEPMKYAHIIRYDRPEWCRPISNSNLVISGDSCAFLIDCGTNDAYNGVMELVNSGRIKSIEGIFLTHYHDDHTEYVNDIAGKFNCPVYATEELKDILENPGAYHLPCLTTRPLDQLTVKKDGDKISWKDFELTFYYFPGQTIYHDAVLFSKKGGESVFFIGDSFTPSGIDDYCLLNRNLLHEGQGFLYCLDILDKLPEGILLANQHVEPLFSWSSEQLDFMKLKLIERNKIFGKLFPWDDINYGIDEKWAAAYPYTQKAVPGNSMELSVRLTNHSLRKRTFNVTANLPGDLSCRNRKVKAGIEPGATKSFDFKVELSEHALAGVKMVTFDVGSDGMEFKDFCEALIVSEDEPVKAYDIDFNWGEGGPNRFAAPGLWADADPKAHVEWYAALGCNVIQSFAVSCNGYAWYKNGIVPEQPGLVHDFLTEQVKLAHERNMKVFGYFCAGSNTRWGLENPEYSYGVPSLPHIPYTTKYLDFLCASIEDAIKKTGMDGVFIDWLWNPGATMEPYPPLKWIPCEQEMFAGLMGQPFPGIDKITPDTELQFRRKAIDRAWKRIKQTVELTDPDCIIWLTSCQLTSRDIAGSDMLREVDWVLNEAGDTATTASARAMLGKDTHMVTCLANWNGQDAAIVIPDAIRKKIGLYGFSKPVNGYAMKPVDYYLSVHPDSLKGDERNIALLARTYNGLAFDYVKK